MRLLVTVFILLSALGCKKAEELLAETPSSTPSSASCAVSSSALVVVCVTVPIETPSDDFIYMKPYGPSAYKMTKVNSTLYRLEMTGVNPGDVIQYSYSRNNVGFQTAEEVTPDRTGSNWNQYRTFTVSATQGYVEDTIPKWRWLVDDSSLPSAPPSSASALTFQARVNSLPFMTGVGMHDYWDNSFLELTDKAATHNISKNMGWVLLYPNGKYNDSLVPPFVIDNEPAGQYTEADLRAQVQKFRAAGIKVAFSIGIVNDAAPNSAQNSAYWDSRFAAYKNYIAWVADIAEDEDVDAIFIMSHALLPGPAAERPDNAITRWQNVMADVRAVYSGKIGYNLHWNKDFDELHPLTNFANIISQFDMIGAIMWDTLGSQNAPTNAELRTEIAAQYDKFLKSVWDDYAKPTVITQVAYTSAAMCHKGDRLYPADTVSISPWEPYDNSVAMDLTLQARVYDAIYAEIASRPYIIGTYIFGQPYWKSIDKNMGVWGKPAEEIISTWYDKAQ